MLKQEKDKEGGFAKRTAWCKVNREGVQGGILCAGSLLLESLLISFDLELLERLQSLSERGVGMVVRRVPV